MYLQAKIKIRAGGLEAYATAFAPLRETVEANGWKLIGAYTSIIGEFNTILHLWEVEEPNTVTEGLHAALADASLKDSFESLAELVVEEKLELMAPLPYHPNP